MESSDPRRPLVHTTPQLDSGAAATSPRHEIGIIASKSGFGTQTLIKTLIAGLHCGCQLRGPQQPLPSTTSLALLNCHDLCPPMITRWLQTNLHQCTAVALYNVPDQPDYDSLISWPKLNGWFYQEASETLLLQGVTRILNGELWLPRKLLGTSLEATRKYNPMSRKVELTPRETDILRLMKHGSSNADIGKQLGMRENTVKSHLYKLYRKIGANNRVDAGNWARINVD